MGDGALYFTNTGGNVNSPRPQEEWDGGWGLIFYLY